MRRAHWIVIAAAACAAPMPMPSPSPSPSPSPLPRISVADLAADRALLVRAIDELHPTADRYRPAAARAAALARLDAALARPRTLGEAYAAIATFVATVRCSHTHANLWNQPAAVTATLLDHDQYLPALFRWVGAGADARMIVTRDLTPDQALPAGTEIVALDGLSAPRLLALLWPMARGDGGNDAGRRATLELRDGDREAFDALLPLVAPRRGPRVALDVRVPGGGRAAVTVAWLSRGARTAALPAASDGKGAAPLWSLDLADPALAVLRMPTWATYDSDWDWAGFLAASFGELARRRTPALVIDLRGNEGGTTAVADALLARLVDREIAVAGAARLVRYRRIPDDLRPHVDTWDPGFLDWGAAATGPDGRGTYRLADAAGATVRPAGPRFTGTVAVLVDAAVSSATFRFARLVRAHRLGVLVGQPTGGNQRATTGGAILFLRLPRTGIEVDVPLIADVPPGEPPDAGLTPDIVVEPRPADLAAGVDSELAAARRALAAATGG